MRFELHVADDGETVLTARTDHPEFIDLPDRRHGIKRYYRMVMTLEEGDGSLHDSLFEGRCARFLQWLLRTEQPLTEEPPA